MTLGQRNLLLLALVVLLAGVPAAFALGWLPSPLGEVTWSGGDTQITETVGTIQEGYEPWMNPLFSPADVGIEPLLFGLQAFLGALLLSALLGYLVGRRSARGVEGSERRTAAIVSAIGLALFAALFFVQTDLGELQAFLAAVQGIGLGTLGFFAGFPMGQRAGSSSPGPARAAG
jgi:cobalt/nickel transport protein